MGRIRNRHKVAQQISRGMQIISLQARRRHPQDGIPGDQVISHLWKGGACKAVKSLLFWGGCDYFFLMQISLLQTKNIWNRKPRFSLRVMD